MEKQQKIKNKKTHNEKHKTKTNNNIEQQHNIDDNKYIKEGKRKKCEDGN